MCHDCRSKSNGDFHQGLAADGSHEQVSLVRKRLALRKAPKRIKKDKNPCFDGPIKTQLDIQTHTKWKLVDTCSEYWYLVLRFGDKHAADAKLFH